MSNKVASLYAEIGLDTTEAERGLEKTKRGFKENETAAERLEKAVGRLAQKDFAEREARAAKVTYEHLSEAEKLAALAAANYADKQEAAARASAKAADKKTVSSWTELKSMVDLAAGAIEKIAEGIKRVYEFGRAGAEIEYAATRFERLSVAIGTTSGVLLNDLRVATKGTRSDMELMASAADLAGLGLAKNHTQVVRLSKVVGGLGMDMNQLVLTLANQTKMRFDQLGVSVVGFDEKVKALKESGMSANDAFTEAFLQQAEEQLERVGNKADENIGKFERFEAAAANMGNTFKTRATPAIAGAADAMAKLLEQANKNAAFDAVTAGMTDVERGIYLTNAALLGMTDAEERARDAARRNSEAQTEAATALESTSSVMEEHKGKNTDLMNITERSADAWDRFQDRVAASNQRLEEARAAISAAEEAGQKLAEAEADWKKGAGGDIASMLKDRVGQGDRYKEGLKAIDEVMGTTLTTEQALKDQQKALADEFARTGDVDKFKKGMQNLNDTYLPLNESIEKATGLVKTLQERVDALTGKTYTVLVRAQVSGDISGAVTSAVTNAGTSVTTTTNSKTKTKTNTNNKPGVKKEAAGGAVFPGATVMMNESSATGTGQPEIFVSSGGGHVLTRQQAQQAISSGGVSISIGELVLQGVQDVHGLLEELGALASRATKSSMYTAGLR